VADGIQNRNSLAFMVGKFLEERAQRVVGKKHREVRTEEVAGDDHVGQVGLREEAFDVVQRDDTKKKPRFFDDVEEAVTDGLER